MRTSGSASRNSRPDALRTAVPSVRLGAVTVVVDPAAEQVRSVG